jgi:hypothetical protein
MTGRSIVLASYITLGVFVVTIVPDAAGLHAFDDLASITALGLFLAAIPIWIYAFGLAVVRSGRGDDVTLASLFFLSGSAPNEVRRPLLAVVAVSIAVAAATAWANPFSTLEPMLPLAFLPLWGARHGTFPARATTAMSR